MTASSKFDRAKDEAERHAGRTAASPWAQGLARAGLATKGILYGIVAVLALLVAFRAGGKLTDRSGALQAVAGQPFGKALLVIFAIGLAGYALWRLLEAALGRPFEGGEEEGAFKRLGNLARGLLYAGLCVTTVLLVFDSDASGGGSGGKEEDRATAWVLELPLGVWIVGAIALGVLGAAAFNAYQAVSGKYKDDFKTGKMSEAEERSLTVAGTVGHAARATVFGLVGIFLLRAALQYDPKEAIGLDGALRKVVEASYGRYLLTLVALGLAAYGVFCLLQARYREV